MKHGPPHDYKGIEPRFSQLMIIVYHLAGSGLVLDDTFLPFALVWALSRRPSHLSFHVPTHALQSDAHGLILQLTPAQTGRCCCTLIRLPTSALAVAAAVVRRLICYITCAVLQSVWVREIMTVCIIDFVHATGSRCCHYVCRQAKSTGSSLGNMPSDVPSKNGV